MPGGERAIREPWRMAVAHLLDAGCSPRRIADRVPGDAVRRVERMIQGRFNTPDTSSAGRLFDAVAAVLGVCDHVSYEGQAAIELEWLANEAGPDDVYPFSLTGESEEAPWSHPLVVATNLTMVAMEKDLDAGVDAAIIARRFHSTMAALIVVVCEQLRTRTEVARVVLSGGVFMNALVTQEVSERLAGNGFKVYRHRLVPPNDGGLSLGQVAVAAATLDENGRTRRAGECAAMNDVECATRPAAD